MRGGWEIKCVPVPVAREITKRSMDDRMWFDKAESKSKWVRVRRPKNKPHLAFEAFSLCDIGGIGSASGDVIHFKGRREKRKKRA